MYPTFIQALQNPSCYAHSVTKPIQIIETEVSWIVLTGDYAYKIKKELNFGFLDFSTLDKRLFYCEEELRLNQRLAPDIYLEVVQILGPIEQPSITKLISPLDECDATNEQPVLEYAVKMVQFNPDNGLNDLLKKNQFESVWIDQLAIQIANFHTQLPMVTYNSPWGAADNIWGLVKDNFEHTLSFYRENTQYTEQLNQLYQRTKEQYQALKSSLEERKKLGYIKECHGDLHLGNITFHDDKLRLFDCIEFNLQFRWIDTFCDLAFLLMDLEANGRYSWANRCLNYYLQETGDYNGLATLNFYKSFRSMVRAKVSTLGPSANPQVFLQYLSLTQRYQLKSPVKLYLMHGLSGTGKSHLSLKMIETISAIRIRSEIERSRLHKELSKKGKKLDLHGPEINARLSQHLLTLTSRLISIGYSVVIDGTFLKQHFRQKYLTLAASLQVPLQIISCQCDAKLCEARVIKGINTRVTDSYYSLDRLQHQISYQQPLSEEERTIEHIVNTDDDEAIAIFLQQLKQANTNDSPL